MFTRKCIVHPRSLRSLVLRNTCSVETPKKTYYRSRIVFSTFLVMLVGAGCFLTYVNYNPKLRDDLKQRSPLMNEIIQFMWQEKKTFKQRIDEILPPKKN